MRRTCADGLTVLMSMCDMGLQDRQETDNKYVDNDSISHGSHRTKFCAMRIIHNCFCEWINTCHMLLFYLCRCYGILCVAFHCILNYNCVCWSVWSVWNVNIKLIGKKLNIEYIIVFLVGTMTCSTMTSSKITSATVTSSQWHLPQWHLSQ